MMRRFALAAAALAALILPVLSLAQQSNDPTAQQKLAPSPTTPDGKVAPPGTKVSPSPGSTEGSGTSTSAQPKAPEPPAATPGGGSKVEPLPGSDTSGTGGSSPKTPSR